MQDVAHCPWTVLSYFKFIFSTGFHLNLIYNLSHFNVQCTYICIYSVDYVILRSLLRRATSQWAKLLVNMLINLYKLSL